MNKKILIAFGLLDLFSFIRTFKLGFGLLEHVIHHPLMTIPIILLIVSLIASGLSSIMRKKISLIIYYIQIPFRIVFMIWTFGFLLELFQLQYDSVEYKILVGITLLLEALRLTFTIMLHKRHFKN